MTPKNMNRKMETCLMPMNLQDAFHRNQGFSTTSVHGMPVRCIDAYVQKPETGIIRKGEFYRAVRSIFGNEWKIFKMQGMFRPHIGIIEGQIENTGFLAHSQTEAQEKLKELEEGHVNAAYKGRLPQCHYSRLLIA